MVNEKEVGYPNNKTYSSFDFFLLLFYNKLQTIGLVERYELQPIFKKGNI